MTDAPVDYMTRSAACIDGISSIRSGVFCANDMFDVRSDISGCGGWTYIANAPPIDEDIWVSDGVVIDADGFIYDSV